MQALSFNLEGKSILVTGGGRGIGKAIALRLGECRAHVGITFSGGNEKSEANAQAVCAEVEKAGGKAIAIACDVSKEEQCTAAIDRMVESFGSLYGLVNNAGVTADQLVLRHKMDDWDKVLNTNLKGAFMMCKAAARPIMKSGGSIVNMSSVVALSGNAGQVSYCASKAGLIGMTKSLAQELSSRQVRVNAVAPGFIETDMTHALNDEQKGKISERIPLKKLGTPDDIAFGTLYLLSPMSSYVTGQVLSINGGLYM